MPMRGELSTTAMYAGRHIRSTESKWPEAFGILGSSDLVVVFILCGIAFVAALCLTLLLPLSDSAAAFLAQAS
jgi:hypothetical protein